MTPKPYTLCGQCYDKDEVDRYIADLEEQHRKKLREVESSWVVTSLGREERAARFAAEQFRDRLKAKDDEIDALKAKVDMQGKEIAYMHQNCKWDAGDGCSRLHGELMACTSDIAEKDRRIADLESQLEAANQQVENLMNSASRIMTMQDSVIDGKCGDLLRQK